jgi:hypothetical protein
MTGHAISVRVLSKMNDSMPEITGWREGCVDTAKERFELRIGSAKEGGWKDWIPVALVGAPIAGVVTVQFLVDRSDPKNAVTISYATKEIQFYLIDLREDEPWTYAKYHSTTGSNVYSNIHWSYYEAGMKNR